MHFWNFKLLNNYLQAEQEKKRQDWNFIIKDMLPDTSEQEDTLYKPTCITWIQGFFFWVLIDQNCQHI